MYNMGWGEDEMWEASKLKIDSERQWVRVSKARYPALNTDG